MRSFLVSRRFLIPFLIAMVFHVGYLTWNFWEIYKADIMGKGIPGSYQVEWVKAEAGVFASLCFLPSFLLAIIFYSHFQSRKGKETYRPFSRFNWIAVFVFSVIVFIYNEYCATAFYFKSMTLLTNFVYARPGENFDSTRVSEFASVAIKNVRMMRLGELFRSKDSIRKEVKGGKVEQRFYSDPGIELKKINIEIGRRLVGPFAIVVFYIIGALLAISFFRTYAIIPLLLGWFVIFYLFYVGNNFLEVKYKYGKVGWFWGMGGMTVLFGFFSLIWYILVRKKLSKSKIIQPVEKDVLL